MDQLKIKELLEFVSSLDMIIQEKASSMACKKPVDAYESAETKEIATALAKAQGEFPVIGMNRENPYFKNTYADLDIIVRSIRPALTKNGLSLTQQIQITEDGATILHTRLRHSSGQWIESRNRIVPAKNDQQTYGSTLSYQKRYALTTLLGITTSSDVNDDDGEVAMAQSRDIIAKGPSNKYNPKDQSADTVSKEQLEELEYELSEVPDLAEEILDKMRIQSLADLPKSKYLISLQRIREIKEARRGVRPLDNK